jgi:hypothetical protein
MFIKNAGFLLAACCFSMVASTAQQSPIGTLRSLDNNHALATDSTDWKVHRIIKEIPLVKEESGTLLSFGGEIREQLRLYNHVNFGDVDSGISDQDFYLQQRYLLHVNLRANRFLRFFTQFNSCFATGKNVINPQVDVDELGIMQAFVDLNARLPFPVQLRLGRQEFFFGQERILGVRDGPTVRQTFDGVRLTLGLKKAKGDIFLVVPVSYLKGVFDNLRRENEYVLSSYWAIPASGLGILDIYYFNAHFQNSSYANDTADETRHSLGLRLNKSAGSFGYDAEFTYQFGKFGSGDIQAWHLSS